MKYKGSSAVVNPYLVFQYSSCPGVEKVVVFCVGSENIREIQRHAMKRYYLVCSVETGGGVGLHHQFYCIAPGGVDIEFHPFTIVGLPDAVDIPVSTSPSVPVCLPGAYAEVFSNDVHVVVGYLIGFGVH